MIIKVITVDLATGKVDDERTTNFKSHNCQRWLANHFTWCFTNGKGVQLFNQDDSELSERLIK